MKKLFDATELIAEAEKSLADARAEIDEIAFVNQKRVLEAFHQHRLCEEYFVEKTGYGINDKAREVIDDIFADVFQAEACAVRMQLVSGTHALACALFGNLKQGQTLVSVTGAPYDTLQEVIGIAGESTGSLKAIGVNYVEIDLIDKDESVRKAELEKIAKNTSPVFYIQKSRGYSFDRLSLSNQQISELIKLIRASHPGCKVLVDNCYGEFVEQCEPTALGADLVAGSLIKNPGGGLAISGGYIAGKKACVEAALDRLTAPGIGGHLGLLYNQNRLLLQGLFLAPGVVSQAVQGAQLMAYVFEKLGMEVSPGPFDKRSDIIQAIRFGKAEPLINFCRALQRFSPVNSHVLPEPSSMPGYQHQVIMAGGTFVSGSTIELSADGPIRPPYAVYLQGGLSLMHVKCALAGALEASSSGQYPFF